MMGRVGILGGTFDPVHAGHLSAAAAAREALSLDRVLLMPSLTPPHRPEHPVASPCHRFTMVALAVADHPGLYASDLELTAPPPSYTSRTLAGLHAQGVPPRDLFFILGSDAFAEIATWHRYPDVLDAAHFVVVARPGTALDFLTPGLPAVANRTVDAATFRTRAADTPRVILLPATTPDVSSTALRERAAAGETLDTLTPAAVITHLARYALYGAPASR